jgi:hypothetical protein
MAKKETALVIPEEIIISKIYYIRDQKVMLDTDLANLYQIETRILKQAVRRNSDRFPDDFMFELTIKENQLLKTQLSNLSRGQHSKYLPYVFTEQGVAMLSSVINSESAIKVNIEIMRIFTRVRQMLADNTKLRLDIEKIKNKVDNQDKNIELVFRYLDELLEKQDKPEPPRKRIGYKPDAEI